MKDPVMKASITLFILGTLLCIGLSFAGSLPWVTTFFLVIMVGISLGAVGEYRRVL